MRVCLCSLPLYLKFKKKLEKASQTGTRRAANGAVHAAGDVPLHKEVEVIELHSVPKFFLKVFVILGPGVNFKGGPGN